MNKILLNIILLFFVSCKESNQSNLSPYQFKNYVFTNWIYSEEIKDLSFRGHLTKPVGFPFLITRIKYLNNQSNALITDCLYYKVPYKNDSGTIFIQQLKDQVDCPELPNEESKKLEDIKKLVIENANHSLMFEIDQLKFSVPLFNIKGVSTHEKLKFERENKKLNGFRLINLNEGLSDKNIYIGSYNHRFSLNTAIQCRKINSQCEVIGEDRCEQCRFGFYQVIDYNCPQGGSRFCGISHCGEKNEPACIRGSITKVDDNDGICNDGLIPVRDKNNILICQ